MKCRVVRYMESESKIHPPWNDMLDAALIHLPRIPR
jgi:hypothetical protein